MWSCNFTIAYLSKKNENISKERLVCKCYSIFIPNNQMSMNRIMDKQILAYLRYGILLSKRKQTQIRMYSISQFLWILRPWKTKI